MAEKAHSKPLKGKLIPAVFGDIFVQGIPKSNPQLDGESAGHVADYALGYLQELVARVHEVCSDQGQTEERKREACEKLFTICGDAASMLFKLATAFPELFKSIASERGNFPCLFPAHPDGQAVLKEFLLERLQLGSKYELKLRAPKGRRTFSFGAVTGLLLRYIGQIHLIRSYLLSLRLSNPWLLLVPLSPIERLDDEFPLAAANAGQWIDMIWELLLKEIPHPEEHPALRSFGNRPSRVGRGAIDAKSQASYRRGAIKEALQKYLVRMLRQQSADK